MNAPPAARSFRRLTIAIVVAAVIISASALSYASFESTITKTTTSAQVNTSTAATTSLSQLTSGSSYPPANYQVIKTGLILQGQAGVVPCTGFNEANCPSPANATLHPVDLITYGGTYYYLYNQTEPTSSSTTTTYTTWFTNSSVVCISPAHPLTNTEHQNPTCPAGPYQPNIVAIPVASTTTANSSLGLRLDLNLSSQSPGSITVAIDLLNTVDRLNNLTADNLWPSGASNLYLWVQDGCGPPTDLPFGYAIFQGNLSKNDIATSVPLTLEAQPGGLFCYNEAPTPFFAFYPLSDVMTTYQWGNVPGLAGNYNVTASTTCTQAHGSDCWWNGLGTWSGYWTGSTQMPESSQVFGGACPSGEQSSSTDQATSYSSSTDCPLTFDQFSPGVYTLVAADEWGQAAILHFTVTPSGSTTTSTECSISGEGTGFYVTVLSDSGQPVQGAQITGTSSPCQQDIGTYVTNSTGSVLITPSIGSYFQLSIAYQGSNYTVKAPIAPMETTYVTLRVPSGNVTISEGFEGGCQTSSGGVSCPG